MGQQDTPTPHEDAPQDRSAALRDKREALFARLNPQQRVAVEGPAESVLVLAGAGSGKTSVLTARIARLVEDKGYRPGSIVAVTFTNKASREMRDRLFALMEGRNVARLAMGTFHSLCARMLREHFAAAGLPKNFAILDVDGQETICKDILKDFVLSKTAVKADLAAKAKAKKPAADLLSEPDDDDGGDEAVVDETEGVEFLAAAAVVKYINRQKEALEPPRKVTGPVTWRSPVDTQQEVVYAEYQARIARSGLLDFQDLLVKTVELLEKNDAVRNGYRSKLRAILVDEFQDTNLLQYRWLELIKGPDAHVMAVGDDSQSIYGFRGAKPENMARFKREMTASPGAPEGRVVKLEENYRSLPHILDAANSIIAGNPDQLPKKLFTSQPDQGEKIDLFHHESGLDEAQHVANEIHALVKGGVAPSEIAVIYRTNQHSRAIEQELNKLGVPVSVYGGFRFYDRREIRDLIAYLDLCMDVTHDLSFLRVANFPKRGLGETSVEGLRQEAQERGISMMEAVGVRHDEFAAGQRTANANGKRVQGLLEGFSNLILELTDYAGNHSLAELIEQIMDKAGIRKSYDDEAKAGKISTEEAAERLANIAELASAARQFELDNPHLQNASAQLPEYLAQVALMSSTSDADMEEKNTVSLMTGHSSKGLEFDNVFIVGLDEGSIPHARAIQQDEEAVAHGQKPEGVAEERRLMYVMVTRARKRLTLHTATERLVNGGFVDCWPSRFIDEIPQARLMVHSAEELEEARTSAAKARLAAAPRKHYGNHEYGGDAFDDTRDGREEQPSAAPEAAPAPLALGAEPAAAGAIGQSGAELATAPPAPQAPAIQVAAPMPPVVPALINGPTSLPHHLDASKPWLKRATPAARGVAIQGEPASAGSGRRVALVGAAGNERHEDLSQDTWALVLADARSRINRGDHLIAGGAAWVEHVAVQLYLEGLVGELTLHLAAPFSGKRFLGPDRSSGAAANMFHERFSRAIGCDTLADIDRAIRRGAFVTSQPEAAGYAGLVGRSRRVAADANCVLAYTFGEGREPLSGGARETWDLVLGPRVHIPIDGLLHVAAVAKNTLEELNTGVLPPAANPVNQLRMRARS